MPLIRFEHINDSISWGLWKIEETLEELKEPLQLNQIDQDYINSFKSHYKKLEWLASRNTVRHMLIELGEDGYAIKKDNCGKPHLINCQYYMSISHSGGYAAVILNKEESTGIDIEQIHEKIRRIDKKFLSESELEDVGDDLEKLSIYWSCKEVLYKVFGRKKLELKTDLFIYPFEKKEKDTVRAEIRYQGQVIPYQLKYERFGDFYICYHLS